MARDVENDDEEVDSEHEKRKKRVNSSFLNTVNPHSVKIFRCLFKVRLCDPVYSVSLKDYCLEKLRECETSIGIEYFQQLMNNSDKSVVQRLNELLNS